jgi:hypothetical protein
VATRNGADHLTGKLIGISESGSLKILRQDNTIIEYDANEIREISSLPARNQNGK